MNRFGNFRALYRDNLTRWLFGAGLVVTIGHWIAWYAVGPSNQGFVPLHYTIYFGIDLTGSWSQLAGWPAAASLSWLAHLLGAVWQSDSVWRRAWASQAMVIILLISLGFAALWFNEIRTI